MNRTHRMETTYQFRFSLVPMPLIVVRTLVSVNGMPSLHLFHGPFGSGLVLLYFCFGHIVVFNVAPLRLFLDYALVVYWLCCGSAMALLWSCFGYAWVLLWCCSGSAMALLWCCSGSALVLL